MKTILLCITVSIFLISCSSDSDFSAAENELPAEKKYQPAENIHNPYDKKGKEIYEKLNAFYEKNKIPNSYSELADQINFISGRHNAENLKSSRLIEFTDEIVKSIMEDPDNNMILIVQGSILGSYAKANLITFLENLIMQRQQEFSISFNYIIDYESDVIADTDLTPDETETILTVASISRYSLYSAEERKDRDWETSVGSRPAKTLFTVKESALTAIIALLGSCIK